MRATLVIFVCRNSLQAKCVICLLYNTFRIIYSQQYGTHIQHLKYDTWALARLSLYNTNKSPFHCNFTIKCNICVDTIDGLLYWRLEDYNETFPFYFPSSTFLFWHDDMKKFFSKLIIILVMKQVFFLYIALLYFF